MDYSGGHLWWSRCADRVGPFQRSLLLGVTEYRSLVRRERLGN